MKYRDHRCTLEESLKTVQEFNTKEELISHLNSIYSQFNRTIAEIKFEYFGFDSRMQWESHYVMQRLEGETHFTVAGMSDSIIE
mgnify:CR=1 FL=1